MRAVRWKHYDCWTRSGSRVGFACRRDDEGGSLYMVESFDGAKRARAHWIPGSKPTSLGGLAADLLGANVVLRAEEWRP